MGRRLGAQVPEPPVFGVVASSMALGFYCSHPIPTPQPVVTMPRPLRVALTARQKKHFEQAMLQGLLQRFTIPAHLVDGDFESPDAVIRLDGRTVGVEVTEIQKSAEERAKRAPKDDILRRAKHAFDVTSRKPVSATFSFIEGEDLRWVSRVEIGEQIAQFLLGQQHEDN